MPTFFSHFIQRRLQTLEIERQEVADRAFGGCLDFVQNLETSVSLLPDDQRHALSEILAMNERQLMILQRFDIEWRTLPVPVNVYVKISGGGVEATLPEYIKTACQAELSAQRISAKQYRATAVVHNKFIVDFIRGSVTHRSMYLPSGDRVPLVITDASLEDDWLFEFDRSCCS